MENFDFNMKIAREELLLFCAYLSYDAGLIKVLLLLLLSINLYLCLKIAKIVTVWFLVSHIS